MNNAIDDASSAPYPVYKALQFVVVVAALGGVLYLLNKEMENNSKGTSSEDTITDTNDDDDDDDEDEEAMKKQHEEDEAAMASLEQILDRSMKLLDRYEILSELGRGGFSVVFKARDRITNEYVAIKEIDTSKLILPRFASEVYILKNLHPHPNIIKFHRLIMEEGKFYIVTEYVDGKELFDKIIEHGVFSEKDARNILRTLGKTIKFLHDRGVVHRDIKPENVLITRDINDFSPSGLKLVDFGFAKPNIHNPRRGMNKKLGTPLYMAPEILRGEPYGTSVDCWAFGVIMFILLTGKPPFPQGSTEQTFNAILRGPVFKPEVWKSKSPEAMRLLQRILNPDPSNRLTMEQILNDPWMRAKSLSSASMAHLGDLHAFVVRRQFKSAITAVMAANRMKLKKDDSGGERSDSS